jgi:hypothetical protein
MYLFSRLATLRGNVRQSTAWAASMSAYVDTNSDHNVSLWRADFGYPVGTVAWSAWVESQAALNAGFASLADDEGYFSLLDAGQEFLTTPAEDFLRQPLHGSPGEAPPAIGAVTTVTTAVVAGGKYDDGVAWGIEMAQLVEEVTKMPTLFLLDSYGTFGQVTWLSGAPDLASADAASNAINGNDKYMKRLGDVGDLFVPASGHRSLVTRIA